MGVADSPAFPGSALNSGILIWYAGILIIVFIASASAQSKTVLNSIVRIFFICM